MGRALYSWVVKRSLYTPLTSTENEILRIGNTKIAGLIPPPTLVDVGLEKVYEAPASELWRW